MAREKVYIRLKPKSAAQPHETYGIRGTRFTAGKWQSYSFNEATASLAQYAEGCRPNGGEVGEPIFQVVGEAEYRRIQTADERRAQRVHEEAVVGADVIANRAPEEAPVIPPSAEELKKGKLDDDDDEGDAGQGAQTPATPPNAATDTEGLDAVAAELKAAEASAQDGEGDDTESTDSKSKSKSKKGKGANS